jgi:hypothetical protein
MNEREPVLPRAWRFVCEKKWVMLAVSALLLVPCYWHRRIEAGDLASHVYNAWLAQLIEKGQAPGVYFSNQWNNVLFDIALLKTGNLFGLAVAEKIAVSACVLIFFWGAFALISAIAQRPPWFLTSCLAMLAYGWTFNMGFFNYYLSLGLGFFAIAILWGGRGAELLLGLALAAIVLVAHPQGFVWLVGCVVYVMLWRRLPGRYKYGLAAAVVLAVVSVRFYVSHHFEFVTVWDSFGPGIYNGSDQLSLYNARFYVLSGVALFFGITCFALDAFSRVRMREPWAPLRLPLELYALVVFATYILPDALRVPVYAGWIGALAARLTAISAVMGLCVLGFMRPKKWHTIGFAAVAIVFFGLLYEATGTLNSMETQIERLVSGLPIGERVTATIWPSPDSRVPFLVHIADRACVGKCFSFQNYEPASGEFRVRVREGSPVVTDDPDLSQQMEAGEYVVKPEDLPMAHIYKCDDNDLTQLCIRQLEAGEINGRIGYHPPKE